MDLLGGGGWGEKERSMLKPWTLLSQMENEIEVVNGKGRLLLLLFSLIILGDIGCI